jgi:hypothetical protein
MISIDWATFIINVPKTDMALVQSSPIEIRELNIDNFRLILKELEANTLGMGFQKTHDHVAPFTVGGVTLSRAVKLLDPYTVTFENGTYAVNLVGANSNIADKVNLNYVSVRSANSAGLVTVTSGSGVTQQDKIDIAGLIHADIETINTKLDDIPTISGITTTVWQDPAVVNINNKLDALPDTTLTSGEITTAVWSTSIGAQVALDTSLCASFITEARVAFTNATIAALAAQVAAEAAVVSASGCLVHITETKAASLLVKKCWQNKLELVTGTTNNWVLYDDDNITPLLTWDVSGPNGEAIVIPPGAAARRTRAH